MKYPILYPSSNLDSLVILTKPDEPWLDYYPELKWWLNLKPETRLGLIDTYNSILYPGPELLFGDVVVIYEHEHIEEAHPKKFYQELLIYKLIKKLWQRK